MGPTYQKRVERNLRAILAACSRIHAESDNTIVDSEAAAIETLAKDLLDQGLSARIVEIGCAR